MRFIVVGGGVGGLAAAHALVHQHGVPGSAVVVLEASDRVGGCLRPVSLEGQTLDAGPDALLTRRPEGIELVRSLELGAQTVAPATGRAYLASGDGLQPYPEHLFLGVPVRPEGVGATELLSEQGRARALEGFVLPPTADTSDVTVAEVVGRRWGTEVADRLAGPLIAAVHAGRADYLSAAACAPQLFPDARPRPSANTTDEVPPFISLQGGLWQLADRLREALQAAGVAVETGRRVQAVTREEQAWTVIAGSDELVADRVVIAVGAPAAADLLAPTVPAAARTMELIELASVAIVTVLLTPSARLPHGSGFLVPPASSGSRLLTACTWFDQKWPQAARGDGRIVRLSTGRHGDARFGELDDSALIAQLTRELAELVGQRLETRSAAVTRFADAFPQYRVGHLGLMAGVQEEIERATSGTLAVCGNAYAGVGLPAVIGSARAAARLVTLRA